MSKRALQKSLTDMLVLQPMRVFTSGGLLLRRAEPFPPPVTRANPKQGGLAEGVRDDDLLLYDGHLCTP